MAGKSAAQLVDVRLVEFKRIDDAFFQDYAKIHERLERMLDKEPRPLSEETVSIAADEFIAWLSAQAAKNVPHDRLSMYLRVGLGHLCSEMIVVPHNLPLEEAAIRAYAELQRRGWDLATYDPEVASSASRRVASLEAARARAKSKAKSQSKKPSSAGKSAGVKKKVIGNPKVAVAKAGKKAASAKKEALMALEKKAAAKKPAAKKAAAKKPAKKAVAKKPAAKKAAAKKPAKKAAAKKPAAKKAVAKKPAKKVAAKKPAAKKAVAKKPAKKVAAKKPAKKAVAKKPAKKAAAKKPAAKKAVAKKPAAKKPAAKKAVAKKPAEPKPAPAFAPIEEKKPDLF